MAGLIARLLGGKAQKGPAEPVPGIGGYSLPPGPAGQTGYPGSTSATRVNNGKSPRAVKLEVDQLGGINNKLSGVPQIRQSAFRADSGPAGPGLNGTPASASPRSTPYVGTYQPQATVELQTNSPAEFYGGPTLKTQNGNNTAGAHPLSEAAAAGGHSVQDTQTPWRNAQPNIGEGTPGAQNVRNQIAQDYKARPGEVRSYKAAPRADQSGSRPGLAIAGEATVPSRFVFDNGGNQTWSVERRMPYTGRGDGARGADLNGQRYYATGQAYEFMNAGQGNYGVSRQEGGDHKSPVSFNEPAPWTSQFYTTTDSVGTADNPNTSPGQQPRNVYISPSTGRASNSTGRTG